MSKSKARKLAEFLRNLTDDAKINTSAVQQDNVVTSRLDLESKANDTEALVTAASVTSYVSNELGDYVRSTHDIPLTFTGDVTGSGIITDMGATSFNLTLDAETLPSQIGHSGKFLTTNGTAASWASLNITNWDTAYGWGNHATQNYAVTTGDTFTGKITASGGIDGLTLSNGITGSNFNITGVNQLTINDPGEGINFHGRVTLFVIDDATDNKINFNGATEVQVNGRRVFESNYHPNADTWTTARTHTVTLAGDVTGSASQSVDGSGNRTWTINTSVGNNSHNHHRSDLSDLGVALSSDIITFDRADNFLSNGPNKDSISYNWLNGFKSTHGGYLHSYLVNDHRTQKWYVNWFDTNTGNSGTWASLWHSENFNPSDYLLTSSYTNTTYAINAQDVSGGKAIRLTGSDGSTDDVTFAAGSNVTLTRSGDTITIASTDTNTDTNTTDWYVANSAGTNQFKVDKNEKVRFEGSGATSVSFDAATNKVTINSTDTNTETTTTLTKVGNELRYVNEAGVTQAIDLSLYLDDTNLARILSGTMNSSGIATFTRDDGTSFTVDMSVLLDDTNLSRIVSASWNTSNGVLTLTRNDSTTVSVDLDNRYLTSYTETDTLQSVTDRGNLTTNSITVDNDSGIKVTHLTNENTWYRGYGIESARATAYIRPTANNTQRLILGNSPTYWSEIVSYTPTITNYTNTIRTYGNNSVEYQERVGTDGSKTSIGNFSNHSLFFRTNNVDRGLFDTSGNFLVNDITNNYSNNGIRLRGGNSNEISVTSTGRRQLLLHRKSDFGSMIEMYQDTNFIGSIGSFNATELMVGSGDTGIRFNSDVDAIIPTNPATASTRPSAIDLGYSNQRFKDGWFSGTVTANNFIGNIDYSNITNPPVIDNSVDYINSASFNTSTGVLTLSGVGRAGATVDLDNRYLTSYSETDTLQSVTSRGNTTNTNINIVRNVSGAKLLVESTETSGQAGVDFKNPALHSRLILDDDDLLRVFNQTSGFDAMSLKSDGSLVIKGGQPLTRGGRAQLSIFGGILSIGDSDNDMSYIRKQGTAQFCWQTNNGNNAGNIQLQPYGGNVIIGSTSGVGKLHVHTGSGAGNENTVFVDRTGTSDYSGISFATAGSVDWSIGQNSVGGFSIYENGLASTTRLVVKDGGNIGMGTTNPGAPLHVYRSVGYTASTDLLRLEGYTPDFGTTPASVNLLFKFQDSNNATNEARIKMAAVNDTDYGDNDEAASNLIFETTNGGVASDKMIITGRGYIGMGTNNPKAPLHVTGNIKSGTTNGGANSTITAPLDRFIEIGVQDGSGAGQAANYTSGSGIVFHHGGTSTSALQHLQPDLNTAIFRFVSDRTNTRIEINNGNTRLHQGSGNSLEVTTNSGWLQLGPQNTGFCHLQSNRTFYFNKRIVVDEGIVDSYNEDLYLRRATSSAHQIRIASGTTTISQNTVINGNLTVNGSIAQADGFGTLYTFNTTQGLSTSWADVTAIAGGAIPTGTYAIQIFVNNSDVGGNSWLEYYSGTMSWYASGTNDNDSNEIPLHNAGHAQNGPLVYARTLRRSQSTMILQLAASGTVGSDGIQIKLRKLI